MFVHVSRCLIYKVQSAFTRTLRNLSRFFLFLGDSLFSIPEVVRFVKNFFQSFFQIFEPFFLFSELFRPPPLPKQLIQYIKPKAVCQELFSSFFLYRCMSVCAAAFATHIVSSSNALKVEPYLITPADSNDHVKVVHMSASRSLKKI